MTLTEQQLKVVMPQAKMSSIRKYLPWLNEWMPKYGITTLERVRHFLSQVAHESAQFLYCEEIASGKAYDTGRLAARLGNTPEQDGDGQKYKGRGLIQITGASNYKSITKDWGVDVFNDPELLETPENAVRSACWFWWKNGLNKRADGGIGVKGITVIVNGGTNGLKERIEFYNRAKAAITIV